MNWHEYPQWNPQSLSKAVPGLDDDGLDLLAVSQILCSHLTFSSHVLLKFSKFNTCFVSLFPANVAVWALQAYFSKESYGAPLLWRPEQGWSLNWANTAKLMRIEIVPFDEQANRSFSECYLLPSSIYVSCVEFVNVSFVQVKKLFLIIPHSLNLAVVLNICYDSSCVKYVMISW